MWLNVKGFRVEEKLGQTTEVVKGRLGSSCTKERKLRPCSVEAERGERFSEKKTNSK